MAPNSLHYLRPGTLGYIPGPAPGGNAWTFDFEPGGINNRGDVTFVADLNNSGGNPIGEGVFLGSRGQSAAQAQALALPGDTVPGGTYSSGLALGLTSINNRGDSSLALQLEPFSPDRVGVGGAVYRHDAGSSTLTPVITPGMLAPGRGGGTFAGAYFNTNIDIHRNVLFAGIVKDAAPAPVPFPDGNPEGLQVGLFQGNAQGRLVSVVRPGDPAPGGGVFDEALDGWANNRGDIAFDAHVAGEETVNIGSTLVAGVSVYLKDASTGSIISIAHQGQPAPGGGTYRLAFGPHVNDRGDVVFTGDLTPAPDNSQIEGVFLYSRATGKTTPIIRPGDLLPGGGRLLSASTQQGNIAINNRGDVTFSAILDTTHIDPQTHMPEHDTGLYLWTNSHEGGNDPTVSGQENSEKGRPALSLIARTGMNIPGVGTILSLRPPGLGGLGFPFVGSGAALNDPGQVFFQATLTDGRGVLLVATPLGHGDVPHQDQKTTQDPGGSMASLGGFLPVDAVDHLIATDADAPLFAPSKKKR
jgi:hypothetical protein